MLKNLTDEELHAMLERHLENVIQLNKEINNENKQYKQVKEELESRHPFYKKMVIQNMMSELDKYKDEINTKAFRTLKRDLKAVIDRFERMNNFRYNDRENILKVIHFNIGYLIFAKIREVFPNFNPNNHSYVISINFSKEIKTTRKHKDMFSQKINNTFSEDDIDMLKKVLSSKINKKFDNYEDVISNLIEIVKYIENEFDQILLGIKMSHY